MDAGNNIFRAPLATMKASFNAILSSSPLISSNKHSQQQQTQASKDNMAINNTANKRFFMSPPTTSPAFKKRLQNGIPSENTGIENVDSEAIQSLNSGPMSDFCVSKELLLVSSMGALEDLDEEEEEVVGHRQGFLDRVENGEVEEVEEDKGEVEDEEEQEEEQSKPAAKKPRAKPQKRRNKRSRKSGYGYQDDEVIRACDIVLPSDMELSDSDLIPVKRKWEEEEEEVVPAAKPKKARTRKTKPSSGKTPKTPKTPKTNASKKQPSSTSTSRPATVKKAKSTTTTTTTTTKSNKKKTPTVLQDTLNVPSEATAAPSPKTQTLATSTFTSPAWNAKHRKVESLALSSSFMEGEIEEWMRDLNDTNEKAVVKSYDFDSKSDSVEPEVEVEVQQDRDDEELEQEVKVVVSVPTDSDLEDAEENQEEAVEEIKDFQTLVADEEQVSEDDQDFDKENIAPTLPTPSIKEKRTTKPAVKRQPKKPAQGIEYWLSKTSSTPIPPRNTWSRRIQKVCHVWPTVYAMKLGLQSGDDARVLVKWVDGSMSVLQSRDVNVAVPVLMIRFYKERL